MSEFLVGDSVRLNEKTLQFYFEHRDKEHHDYFRSLRTNRGIVKNVMPGGSNTIYAVKFDHLSHISHWYEYELEYHLCIIDDILT